MKKILSIKFAALLAIFIVLIIQDLRAQCNANFSYTLGASGSVTFVSTSTGTTTNTNYSWQLGTINLNSGGTTIIHTYNDNQIYTVSLVITDNSVTPICNSTITRTIGINTAPCNLVNNIYHNPAPNGIVHFFNAPAGQNSVGNNGYIFSWAFGDGVTSNNAAPTHTYLLSGTYNVSITATSYSGVCTYTSTKTISVSATPCALVAAISQTNGSNNIIHLASTSTGTNNNTTYRWNFFGLNQIGILYNSTPTQTINSLNNGTFPIALAVEYNSPFHCIDSVTHIVTISNSTCSATSPFTLQKVANQNFTWNGLVSYPSNVSSVNWNWGDGTSSNSLFPTHVYAAAGQYNICLTVTVSCGTVYSACTNTFLNKPTKDNSDQMITVNIIQDPTTSIASIDNQNQKISIFPNPNNSSFSLQLNDFEKGKEVNLTITNLLGEEIYSEKFLINESIETKKLELSEAKSGTYFVKLHDGDKVKVTKLLIVK